MRRTHVHVVGYLSITLRCLLLAAGVHAQSPPGSITNLTIDSEIMQRVKPKWENGFFITRNITERPGMVVAIDSRGSVVMRSNISFPDAPQIYLTDVAAAKNGVFAASGVAYNSGGAGATFIAFISSTGRIDRVVRTAPFAPIRISFGGDNTLWAFGREYSPDFKGSPPHDTLHQYGTDGRLLKSVLPRSDFSELEVHSHPALSSLMVPTQDGIGIYVTNLGQWLEISNSGVIQRWPGVKTKTRMMVSGVTMTPSGTVFSSVVHFNDEQHGETVKLYRLEKNTSTWVVIDTTNMPELNNSNLYGNDGLNLIVSSRLPRFMLVPIRE